MGCNLQKSRKIQETLFGTQQVIDNTLQQEEEVEEGEQGDA